MQHNQHSNEGTVKNDALLTYSINHSYCKFAIMHSAIKAINYCLISRFASENKN